MLELKLWRMRHRLTQAQLAVQVGIGASTLALLENERMRPTENQMARFRARFGPNAEAMFHRIPECGGDAA
jgi:transcriptional regulator with XRE-family HTH domain